VADARRVVIEAVPEPLYIWMYCPSFDILRRMVICRGVAGAPPVHKVAVAAHELSRLIEKAQSGEEVIIAKSGKPVARLTPIRTTRKRVFGAAAGRIVFHKGWNAPMGEKELKDFPGL
jgi:prevent-host-death family protein